MNEKSKSELGPEEVELIVRQMIENWKQGLPQTDVFKEELEFHDGVIENMKRDEVAEEYWKSFVEKEGKTNNFRMQFSPSGQESAMQGGISPAFRPFYINSRYQEVWNKMCQEFPADVQRVIELELKIEKGSVSATDQEKESLRILADYLIEKGKVPATLVCQ